MDRLIDEKTAETLKTRFAEILKNDIGIKVYTDEKSEYGQFAAQFMRELAGISGRVQLTVLTASQAPASGPAVDPTIVIGENLGFKMVFSGTPAGHEANTILETVILAGTGEDVLPQRDLEMVRLLDRPVKIQVFVTTTCPYCPKMAVLAYRLAMANPAMITAEVIEAQENPDLAKNFGVSSVPMQVINGDPHSKTGGVQQTGSFLRQVLHYGYSGHEALFEKLDEEAAKAYELSDNPEGAVMLAEGNMDAALKKYPKLVVDCWAEWCAPCKMMGPVIDELARDYAGRVVYGKLNVDENPGLSAKFRVDSIPSFLVFQNGELLEKLTGARPRAELENEINSKLKTLIV